jgi:uncharacterized membrane protein
MRVLGVVRFIAVICSGLVAGIFLCTLATKPARDAVSATSFVQQQQIIHTYFVVMMPILILSTLLTLLVWLWLVRSRETRATFWLVAVATIGIVFVFVLTRIVNVPINDQLMTWSISAPPANLRELWRPWEQANFVRTIVSIAEFGFAVLALSRGRVSN